LQDNQALGLASTTLRSFRYSPKCLGRVVI
jgi:hypothetical protein